MKHAFQIGQTVEYTGLSVPKAHCMYGDHFRVRRLLPHGTTYGDGRYTTVGDWVECFGGIIGQTTVIPSKQLKPVSIPCFCDVCDSDA